MNGIQQQPGAWRISGRRCEVVEAKLPTSDWMTQDELDDIEDELMRVTGWQIVGAVVVLVLSIAAAAYWPGVWFAGWLR
jgi:hypothetical protein